MAGAWTGPDLPENEAYGGPSLHFGAEGDCAPIDSVASISGMKVVADRARCCGGGQCVLSAPEVFDQDDEGIVVVLQPEPDSRLLEDVRNAVHVCPAACISIVLPTD